MNILAVETSGYTSSLALLSDTTVLQAATSSPGATHSEELVPLAHRLLRDARWSPRDVDLLAVVNGPGSFTGLRLGVTFAKIFAYVAGAKVYALNTLEVVAAGIPTTLGSGAAISLALDAQRGEVMALDFTESDGVFRPCGEMRRLAFTAWVEGRAENVLLGGPILATKLAKLAPDAPVLAEATWRPTAVSAGLLALAKSRENVPPTDIWALLPLYSRPSAAEERAFPERPPR